MKSAFLIEDSDKCTLTFSLISTRVHTVEILPKKIRSTFHLIAHALASLGAASSAYHMVSPSMTFLLVGIVVGVITFLLSCLTWTFPETRTLVMGNGSNRASSTNDGDEKSALTKADDSPEPSIEPV